MTPIERAVEALGGISAAGRAVGVSHEAVRHWLRGANRITAERAIQIETATAGRVTRADLRPDLFGDLPAPAHPAPANTPAVAVVGQQAA